MSKEDKQACLDEVSLKSTDDMFEEIIAGIELPTFDEVESSLKSRVEKDSRSQKSRDALIKRCKRFYDFEEKKLLFPH